MYHIKTVFTFLFLLPYFYSFAQKTPYFSPSGFETDSALNRIFIAGKTAREVRSHHLTNFMLSQSFFTELPPKALKTTPDDLLVACSHSEGELLIIDKKTFRQKAKIATGHGACDVAVAPDYAAAYVANQFSNDISVIDLIKRKETARIPVLRQPTKITLSKDGNYLFAANFLPAGRANTDTVTAEVSIIDLGKASVVKNIPLANGSNALRGMCLSPDGHYVFVSHNLGRFQIPTTQVEQGWMNTSALSVIDAIRKKYVATILLDEPEKGAAGSWGIDCSPGYLLVAHSGTHDFSIIDYQGFIEKLNGTKNKKTLAYDLRFLSGIRKRINVSGNGPRTLEISKNKVTVANYFSDNIEFFDLNHPSPARKLDLTENPEIDEIRRGEIYFNDASYCFQEWQSCNGCHPGDARTDGLNWDLLNDGMGNSKNCKSLLLAHKTPPAMISGARPTAEAAVRAGFTHIQFVHIEEEKAKAVDAYLKSLKAIPSPFLINGKLTRKARKGKTVFEKSGCVDCHPAPLFTDLNMHEMGTPGIYDRQNRWDTPTLKEVWRTSPYLHDGRCATMKEVFSTEKHGLKKTLPEEELNWLVEYVLSL